MTNIKNKIKMKGALTAPPKPLMSRWKQIYGGSLFLVSLQQILTHKTFSFGISILKPKSVKERIPIIITSKAGRMTQSCTPQHDPSSMQSSDYAPHNSDDSSIVRENLRNNLTDGTEGKWTEEENLKYVSFMLYHRKIFSCKTKRKAQRIFKKMSEFLVTRKARQCRSHYQKLMKRFKNLGSCERFYLQKYGVEGFQIKYQEIVSDFEILQPKIQSDATEPSGTGFRSVGVQADLEPNPGLKQWSSWWESQQRSQMYLGCYGMLPWAGGVDHHFNFF